MRPRVGAVRDFPKGCGPRKNCPLRPRVEAVRDFPQGCGRLVVSSLKSSGADHAICVDNFGKHAKEKSLIPFGKDKELQHRVVSHKLSVVNVVDKDCNKVNKALAAFEETLTEMDRECDANNSSKQKGWNLYIEAAMYLKKQDKWVNTRKRIGHIPGVKVGDKFRFRVELAIVGLHSQFQSGIDYMKNDGKTLATSVVESGRYDNATESPDVMTYTGQGGNPMVTKGKPKDQKPERGNLALMNSKEARTPVRVIRSYKFPKESGYVYDGLYMVDDFWQERGDFHKLVYKFLLSRMSEQPKLTLCNS